VTMSSDPGWPAVAPFALPVTVDEDEEGEWEYEYEESETEDFFFTLDLSCLPEEVRPRARPMVTGVAAETSVFARGSEVDAAAEHDDVQMDSTGGVEEGPVRSLTPTNSADEQDSADDEAEISRLQNQTQERSSGEGPGVARERQKEEQGQVTESIQVMALESENPILNYNGNIYSCRWASALGTDLFFANKADVTELEHMPLREFASFNLVGAGAARLIARPAELKPKKVAGLSHESQDHVLARNPIKVPVAPSASNFAKSQASFLERLDAIKAAHGEQDEVLHRTNYKPQKGLQNWLAQRRAQISTVAR
jgi:hypothetical protein